MIETIRNLLMYVVMPLWLIADLLDWKAHRNTDSENTKTTSESMLYVLLILEMAIPLAAAVFFKINATFFVVASIALLIHQFIVYVGLKDEALKSPQLKADFDLIDANSDKIISRAEWNTYRNIGR